MENQSQENVNRAIIFYEALVERYPQPEAWALNLKKTIHTLKHSIERTNFYRFLFNPTTYVFCPIVETISKDDAVEFTKRAAAFDKENQSNEYRNGSVVKIVYGT
jgi:hypothetical protein